MRLSAILLLSLVVGVSQSAAHAETPFIVVQSTTSTENSGLFDAILPQFTEEHGVDVRVVAVGTGQAIRNAENGDGDVLLVHAKPAEEAFVAAGHGLKRQDVMYNDFVIVGPSDDPAKLGEAQSARDAMAAISETSSIFASRGDDSGTHKAELRLWSLADVDASASSGQWYRETGAGMGATLNTGIAMGAYVLTDRATWIAFGNKQNHRILFEGDPVLFNQYGVILVNPARHSHVKAQAGQSFIDWILGADGQAAIARYKVAGQQLFFPNARP